MHGLGLLHSRILEGRRQFEGERLTVEGIVADGGGTGLKQPGEQGMVHHHSLAQGQGQMGIAVVHGAIEALADFVVGLACSREGEHLGGVHASHLHVAARFSGNGTGEIAKQVAQGLISLEILRHLGQRQGPALVARGLGMSLAELQEGGIGQIGADRGCHGAFIGLQHGGRVDDPQNPLLAQQLNRLANARIHTDGVEAGTVGVQNHQLVAPDGGHLQQGQLLIGESGVGVVAEPVGRHG